VYRKVEDKYWSRDSLVEERVSKVLEKMWVG